MILKFMRDFSVNLSGARRLLKAESANLDRLKALKARNSANRAKAEALAESLHKSYSDLEQLRADIQSEEEEISFADADDALWLAETTQSLLETKQSLGL